MTPDTVPVTFAYTLGQRVRSLPEPDRIWRVVSRHWHDNGQAPYCTYGLLPAEHPVYPAYTGYVEAELVPVEDEA